MVKLGDVVQDVHDSDLEMLYEESSLFKKEKHLRPFLTLVRIAPISTLQQTFSRALVLKKSLRMLLQIP